MFCPCPTTKGIRLILEALIAFLPSPADGAIGALDWSSTERKRLAAKSKDFCCPCCGKVANLLPTLKDSSAAKKPSRFQKEIEELTRMQTQAHKKTEEEEEKEMKKSFSAEEKTAETPNEKAAAEEVPADATTPPPPTTTNNAVDSTTAEPAAVVSPAPVAAEANPIAPREQPVVAPPPPRVEPPAAVPPPLELDGADENDKPRWLVEPALQLAIVVLSVICFLLIRKIQVLCAELQALED